MLCCCSIAVAASLRQARLIKAFASFTRAAWSLGDATAEFLQELADSRMQGLAAHRTLPGQQREELVAGLLIHSASYLMQPGEVRAVFQPWQRSAAHGGLTAARNARGSCSYSSFIAAGS